MGTKIGKTATIYFDQKPIFITEKLLRMRVKLLEKKQLKLNYQLEIQKSTSLECEDKSNFGRNSTKKGRNSTKTSKKPKNLQLKSTKNPKN